MTRHADLDPDLHELASRLESERPVPGAAFRGDLRRRLLSSPGRSGEPARVRLMISACAGSGTALLAIAAVGVAGLGPFAS